MANVYARALGKSLMVPSATSSAMVTTAAAAGKAKMTAMATTAASNLAEMKKKAATTIATSSDDESAGKEIVVAAVAPAPARRNVFDVISRLADRPFVSADSSEKLRHLGKKLGRKMTAEAAQTTFCKVNLNRLLRNLDAALEEAEDALDDIEHQHLCLQGLIMDDKKNLASKVVFGVKRSRIKTRIEKRRDEVEAVIDKAYRMVVVPKKKSKKAK